MTTHEDILNTEKFKTISQDAIIRVGKDVRSLIKDPVDHVHYIHSTRSVNKGYAVVIGSHGTPYFCVPMFYNLHFPCDYPHSPPHMKFLSYSSPNGTKVRMHPNYYVNGKCCLSILNSWNGDKWTGCQTIRSVLTTILMTLTDNPLENEPGHTKHSKCNDAYKAIVADAGLNWLANFLVAGKEKRSLVRFCEDDEENDEINQKFYEYIVEYVVKHADFGKKLIKLLTDNDEQQKAKMETQNQSTIHAENYLNKMMVLFDNKSHEIPCYRMICFIDFNKTQRKLISELNKFNT